MKIERLMNIILYLNNHQRVTADELAQRYGVSVKTIRRDMDAISAAGIPVVAYQGREGGYEILQDFKIDRSVLTRGESALLLKLLEGLRKTFPFHGIVNLQEKFSALPNENEHHSNSKLFIDFSAWGMNEKMLERMEFIEEAFQKNRRVVFSYRNLQGKNSFRQVEPLKLIFKASSWYLLAWCLQKEDYRFFKIRRMRDIAIGDIFEDTHDTHFVDLQNSWQQMPAEEVKLVISESFKHRIDDYIDEYTMKDNIVTFCWPVDEWLCSYILSMGEDVCVIAPERLRIAVKSKITAMMMLYNR